FLIVFFFQAEDGIRDYKVTGVQTCALPIWWVEEYENARTAFARFIGAEQDEVAVVPSASAGINSVASALHFGKRRKIVMGEFEFPTMGQIWLAQRPRGAEVKFLEAKNGRICAECYARAIDEQ